MKHLKVGDTLFVNIGHTTMPAIVTYNGPRFYAPLEKPELDVVYKSKYGWGNIACLSKQMYGGDGTRIVLTEKKFFNK